MKEDEPKMILFVIFHYGLDHGLQLKSYLNLIIKSNYWLLQMEKREIKIQKSFIWLLFSKYLRKRTSH